MIFAAGLAMLTIGFYIQKIWGSKPGRPLNYADWVWVPCFAIAPICMVVSLCMMAAKYLP